MINKITSIAALVLCLCFLWMPMTAQAASSAEDNTIMPDNECSLTVSYCYGETAFADLEVKLYRIAEISADFKYTLTQPFAATGLVLNGIRNSGEWDVIRSTLQAHILANGREPYEVAETDEEGLVLFAGLETGMYLAVVEQTESDDLSFRFDAALVSLPMLGQDGRWQYDVTVNAKPEALPPVDSDEEQELRVLKLWKGDEGRTDRPESVTVEIFRDGVPQKTVVLSEENHWSYAWSVKKDGALWSVVERNIPRGYTVTVEQRTATFVLTNTRTPSVPGDPVKPPQTDDMPNLLPYVILALLSVGGFALCIARKRTAR